jgi:4-amino-4-deoxy-L-arabinose transferase-like glycosyltransferase
VSAQTKTLHWWTTIVVLLILAFGTRVWNLSSAPPGLTHDEASNGHDSAAILEGEHRIYFPVGYGHEPLYNYSVALTTLLLSQSIFTLRITTVAWALTQCLLTAALARRWWGRQAVVVVLAAYCAGFWALMLSRVGLRAPTLPTLLAGSVLAYDRAIHPRAGQRSRPWYALSGLLLGASLYTYMAGRGMPLLYVIFLIALAITDRAALRRVWAGTLALLIIALLVSAPLWLYLRANPELEQRIGQLGAAITALGQGQWRPIWTNISAGLPMLFTSADPQWLYNIAGRPGLEPLLALLFVVGLARSLSELRIGRGNADTADMCEHRPHDSATSTVCSLTQLTRHRSILLLTWIAGGLAPALLTPVDYNLLHAIAAMPAVMLTIAAGAAGISGWLAAHVDHRRRWIRTTVAAIAIMAFAATIAGTIHAYFVTWAENRDVHVAYHQHVVALGRYLNAQSDRRPVVVTSLYPGEVHDPYTMEVTLRREDLSLRWADGRDALFVPSGDTRLVVEKQTQPPAELWTWLGPDLTPLVTLRFGEDDIPAVVQGYSWDAPASWERLTGSLSREVRVQSGDPPPAAAHSAIETPVGFADTVILTGYRWITASPSSGAPSAGAPAGATLDLLTAWEVDAATDLDLVIFAHLLAEDGSLVTQDDRMAAPSWQWQPGDRFVHVHRVPLPADLATGSYVVALGLYDRATLNRLPICAESYCTDPQATRLLLPLEVPKR